MDTVAKKAQPPAYRLRVGVGEDTPPVLLYSVTEGNVSAPQADLHIIGTVMLIQQEDGNYGVIQMGPEYDTEFVVGLLQRELLRFEGHGIEITVRRLGRDPTPLVRAEE